MKEMSNVSNKAGSGISPLMTFSCTAVTNSFEMPSKNFTARQKTAALKIRDVIVFLLVDSSVVSSNIVSCTITVGKSIICANTNSVQPFEGGNALITILLTFLRYMALWLARICGRIYYFLSSEWMPPLFWLFVVIFSVSIVDYISLVNFDVLSHSKVKPLPTQCTLIWFQLGSQQCSQLWPQLWSRLWSQLGSILALYTLLWLLWWAWKARKSLVIEDFANYAGTQFDTDVKGLATLLVVKLGQLHRLYRAVDERRAIPTSVAKNEAIDATIKVEDVGQFLKDAVSSQSKLSLGPIEIPIGILMSLLGHIVQGPRIIGSLHKDNGDLVLTAQIVGGKYPFKWRVNSASLPVQSTDQSPHDLVDMVEELVYRMFTDLELVGSSRASATAAFCEGLKAYRDCLRTPKDRLRNLKIAEKQFIQTLAEDVQFDLAYYNLGVVYTELGQTEAALATFEKAITQNPNSWIAYYALALGRLESQEYYRAAQLCKRVIELKPGRANIAKAYQLRGLAQFELYRQERESMQKRADYLKDSTRSRRKAITRSWLALCLAELKGKGIVAAEQSNISQIETLASVCLADLATIYIDDVDTKEVDKTAGIKKPGGWWSHFRAEMLLKQALSLKRADPTYEASYNFKLGKTYNLRHKYEKATHELRVATRIIPDEVEYWSELASAYANEVTGKNGNKLKRSRVIRDVNYEKFVLETIIDLAQEAPAETFKKAIGQARKAYEELDELDECDRGRGQSVKEIEAFLDLPYFLDLLPKVEDPPKKAELEKKLAYYRYHQKEMEYAQVFLSLDSVYPDYEREREVDKLIAGLRCQLEKFNKTGKEVEHAHIALALCQLYLKCGKKQEFTDLVKKLVQRLEQFNRTEKVLLHAQVSLTLVKLCLAFDNDSSPGQLYLTFKKKWNFDNLITKLALHSGHFADDGKEWQHGQMLRILAQLHFYVGKFEAAETYFKDAIRKLDKKYPNEVRSHHLHSWLAHTLLKLSKFDEALQVVQEAIRHDELNCTNRETLGDVYFERGEFQQAIDTWKDTLWRKNSIMRNTHEYEIKYDPEIYFKIGDAYVKLAQCHRELCRRKEENKEAVKYLELALDLFDSDRQEVRLKVCYSLGYFHFVMSEYENAIKHLRICQKFGFAPLTSTFYLAYAYMRNKEYDEAIKQFCALCDLATDAQRKGRALTEMMEETIEPIVLGEMFALAHWGQAFTYAERNMDLPKALAQINEAHKQVARTRKWISKFHETEKKVEILFQARYYDCEGWILYKLEKFDKAIVCLEQALKLTVHAEVYLHVALAYEGKLRQTSDKKRAQTLITKAQMYLQHAYELDTNDQYKQQLEDLQKRLQEISQPLSPAFSKAK